jgi:hypothetical protein
LNGDVVHAKNASLVVIEQVLSDTQFLVDYTGFALLRSEFIRLIGESVVVADDGDGDSAPMPGGDSQFKLKVYLGVTCGALVGVLLVIAALYRNHRIAQKRRRFFHLEDDNRWMMVDGTIVGRAEEGDEADGASPGVRVGEHSPRLRHSWSVSDLTSDSQSIMSSLHMDRIAEEGSSYQTDEEAAPNDDGKAAEGQVDFIAHWKDPIEGEDLTDDEMAEPTRGEEDGTPESRSNITKASAPTDNDILDDRSRPDRTSTPAVQPNEADAGPRAVSLQNFMIRSSSGSMSSSSDDDSDGPLLLVSPSSDEAWKFVRSTKPLVVPAGAVDNKSKFFRGDPFWRSKVFRPKEVHVEANRHPRIPGPLPTLSANGCAQEQSKENQNPVSPVHYNLPIIGSSESSWSENVEIVMDETGKLLQNWAASAMENLSLYRNQKRIGT